MPDQDLQDWLKTGEEEVRPVQGEHRIEKTWKILKKRALRVEAVHGRWERTWVDERKHRFPGPKR